MWELMSPYLQKLLPQHLLSQWVYRATRWTFSPWKNWLIRIIINKYNIDMSLAAGASLEEYASFNDFFTRRLRPESRPIASIAGGLTSPVDATVSAAGEIQSNQLLQVKGKYYSLEALFHHDKELAAHYLDGSFITLYLSPRDYHRVHIPIDGELVSMSYIPGKLFSVNAATTNRIERLFTRNERIIIRFQTSIGRVAVVLVGAIFVGSMETIWHGRITPTKTRAYQKWEYENTSINRQFRRGDEIGRFNMGSTVLVLTEKDKIKWDAHCVPGKWLAMGEQIATSI